MDGGMRKSSPRSDMRPSSKITKSRPIAAVVNADGAHGWTIVPRSEEHTSELQSPDHHSLPTRRPSDLDLTVRTGWHALEIFLEVVVVQQVVRQPDGRGDEEELPAIRHASVLQDHKIEAHSRGGERGRGTRLDHRP